jgi:hypothetical protein
MQPIRITYVSDTLKKNLLSLPGLNALEKCKVEDHQEDKDVEVKASDKEEENEEEEQQQQQQKDGEEGDHQDEEDPQGKLCLKLFKL